MFKNIISSDPTDKTVPFIIIKLDPKTTRLDGMGVTTCSRIDPVNTAKAPWLRINPSKLDKVLLNIETLTRFITKYLHSYNLLKKVTLKLSVYLKTKLHIHKLLFLKNGQ